jgi:uncharacterized protein (DUF697 family)
MPRAKRSDRLLQKLNRSLASETPAAAIPAETSPVAKQTTASGPAQELEVITSAPAQAIPSEALSLTLPPAAAASAGAARSSAEQRAQAEDVLRRYVPLVAGAGLIPLPGVDLVAVGGLQLKMLAALARCYDVAFTRGQGEAILTSLLGSVGGTLVAGGAIGSMAKFFPGVGTILSLATLPIASSVVTQAVGRLAIDHFEAGGTMETFDLDLAQQALERKLAEAKRAFA